MERIIIKYPSSGSKPSLIEKINQALFEKGIEIALEYDDERVYFTGERARDSRLDCTSELR